MLDSQTDRKIALYSYIDYLAKGNRSDEADECQWNKHGAASPGADLGRRRIHREFYKMLLLRIVFVILSHGVIYERLGAAHSATRQSALNLI